MAATFDRELGVILREAGCAPVRHGMHEISYSPISKRHVPVPNGVLSRRTANAVLKQAGLPKRF